MPPPGEPDDVELMRRFQGGDGSAFDALVRRHLHFVVRHARRYFTDAASSEDVAQEVFLRLYRSRDRFRDAGNFLGWLATITRRAALNELRTRRRKHWRPASTVAEATRRQEWRGDGTGADDPADPLLRAERESAVIAAIERLPERQRIALWLQRFEGWDLPAVGTALELSVPAVKSLLFRARESLMTELEAFVKDPHPLAPRRLP